MEHLPAPSGPGTVVLEIGGDIGAAIVHAPPSLDGAEIEIRLISRPWEGHHVAVRGRHLPAGVVHAAVFEALEAGRYDVRMRGDASDEPLRSFDVEGGRVSVARLGVEPGD